MLRNGEEAAVLCGGRASADRDVRTFVFAVLKEDGQFLEGLVSGPGQGADGGLLLPSRSLSPATLAASPEAHCAGWSSRLASLSACGAPTGPHAGAANGREAGRTNGFSASVQKRRRLCEMYSQVSAVEEERGGKPLEGTRRRERVRAATQKLMQMCVLLAFVTEGEGLVLAGPLLAVIGDWGGGRSKK